MENNSSTDLAPILRTIENFKTLLKTSDGNTPEEAVQFFENVAALTVEYVTAIEKYYNECKPSKLQYYETVVHLMKFCSICELAGSKYFNIKKYPQQELIFELRRFICTYLSALLDTINDIIHKTDEKNDIGIFLNLMNAALEKISQIDIYKGSEIALSNLSMAHNIIEEILCLSMAISQVALDDDPKIITAACQSVLTTLEDIKIEIKKKPPNKAFFNLVIDICSDTLCALETKVNNGVLRLCLKVFSDYKQPLESLIHNTSDDILISKFDLHMDRIFQIAMFSLASSSINRGVATIKAVMGNLEFLEAELIPVIIANAGKGPQEGKTFADLLRQFWCQQVKCLQKTIYGIIEPSAYCKLIYEELTPQIAALWCNISQGTSIQKCRWDPFIKHIQELVNMITACLESFDEHKLEDVKKKLRTVHCILKELKAFKDLLQQEQEHNTFNSNQRMFKRCGIAVGAIKQLWLCIAGEQEVYERDPRDYPPSETDNPSENLQLTNIINKSKKLLKVRRSYNINNVSFSLAETNNLHSTTNTGYMRKTPYVANRDYRELSIVNDIVPIMDATFK